MEYSVSFTAGALMREASMRIIEEARRGTDLSEVDPDVLDVNSRRGRNRKTMEITNRLKRADRSVWEDLPECTVQEQHLALYYCCLKTYRLLFDFHMDVVLPKWQSFDRELQPHDARRFLERRADQHPEIDSWSASTWEKIRQVMLKMLREARLLVNGKLEAPHVSSAFWKRFVEIGDVWFLEASFMNEETRRSVVASVTS